jgi:hypothetical protein
MGPTASMIFAWILLSPSISTWCFISADFTGYFSCELSRVSPELHVSPIFLEDEDSSQFLAQNLLCNYELQIWQLEILNLATPCSC